MNLCLVKVGWTLSQKLCDWIFLLLEVLKLLPLIFLRHVWGKFDFSVIKLVLLFKELPNFHSLGQLYRSLGSLELIEKRRLSDALIVDFCVNRALVLSLAVSLLLACTFGRNWRLSILHLKNKSKSSRWSLLCEVLETAWFITYNLLLGIVKVMKM